MRSHTGPHIQGSEEKKRPPLFAIHFSPIPQSQVSLLKQGSQEFIHRTIPHQFDSSPLPHPFLFLFQEELEDFPLPTVQHCQTVLNQMRYSSILLLVCQDSEQHKPDIHFFNCDEVEVSRARLAAVKQRTKYAPSCLPAPSSFAFLEASILSKAKPLKTSPFYL